MERMVVAGSLTLYHDILADVRNDGLYHPIRGLVQPDNPDVRDIARILVQADDFIGAAQEFVNSFTSYRREIGEFWAEPGEMLETRAGDCDDSSILLCSILRNYIGPDKVFVAIGTWRVNRKPDGHAWVVTQTDDGEDLILESTAHPSKPLKGRYVLSAMFNDYYTFATDIGIKDFNLKPVEKETEVVNSR
jgi:hypothetical protein